MMQAQTVAQAKIEASQSLWQFLMALPGTMEAQIFYALMIGGILGMIGHYIRARAVGTIDGNPIDYFFRQNFWRSVGAVAAVAAELFGEVGTGLFTTDTDAFVGWGIVILSGIKTGYLGDSIINKGSRTEWPAEKRAAVTAQQPQLETKP